MDPERKGNELEGLRVWTIGHSTRPLEEFVALLNEQGIRTLVDVRHFPGSRRLPQFNKENLEQALPGEGIAYEHVLDLGGRRKVREDSPNTAWRNESFRGYADYMETPEFERGLSRLVEVARASPAAIMCAEGVWWRCHRSLIADALKVRGATVLHIMGPGKVDEHPYTSAATVENGVLSYAGEAKEEHRGLFGG